MMTDQPSIREAVDQLPDVVALLLQEATSATERTPTEPPDDRFDAERDAPYAIDHFKRLERHTRPLTDYYEVLLPDLPGGVRATVTRSSEYGLYIDLRGGCFGAGGFCINARSDQVQQTLRFLIAGNVALSGVRDAAD